MKTVVIVPGYTNSGPNHWQSIIEDKYKNVVRVVQNNWNYPDREDWIEGLDKTIQSIKGDIFLVGHSCGSICIAQWGGTKKNKNILGALLVAPADVDAVDTIEDIKIQGPIPYNKLSFPSTLIYSDNDKFLTKERAIEFSNSWGSKAIEIASAGHINTDSGYGEWLYAENLIRSLFKGGLEEY